MSSASYVCMYAMYMCLMYVCIRVHNVCILHVYNVCMHPSLAPERLSGVYSSTAGTLAPKVSAQQRARNNRILIFSETVLFTFQ